METLQEDNVPQQTFEQGTTVKPNTKKKLWTDIFIGIAFIVVFLLAFGNRKENWIGYLFLISLAFISVLIVLRHLIRKEVFKKENLSKTIGTIALICGILIIRIIGFATILTYALQLLIFAVLIGVMVILGRKMGWNLKYVAIAGIILFPIIWIMSTPGEIYGRYNSISNRENRNNFFELYKSGTIKLHVDMGGRFPVINRTGNYVYDKDKNTITTQFNDGMPNTELQLKKGDGCWVIINGESTYNQNPKTTSFADYQNN